jgi:DNA polymerase
VACDQLLECQPAIEAAGFEIILDVHDEDVTEAPIDRDDLNPELLGEMMCADLGWNAGLPLAAAGWEGQRYHKQ